MDAPLYKGGMEQTLPIVIAIDGLAATGKGTIARRLAAALDYAYLDTGLLYRAVGLALLRKGVDPSDPVLAEAEAQALDSKGLIERADDPALRGDEAGIAASKVAAIPAVRAALLKFQRNFAYAPPGGKKGAVLDGRDIGTVIAPDALVKIFVTASPKVRARRRFLELQGRGEHVTEAAVLADMQARDARDASRDVAPARPAANAEQLDTSSLTADEAFEKALHIAQAKIATA